MKGKNKNVMLCCESIFIIWNVTAGFHPLRSFAGLWKTLVGVKIIFTF